MFKIITFSLYFFTLIFLVSCNSNETSNENTPLDTSKNVLTALIDNSKSSEILKKRNVEPTNEFATPNTFLGLRLGMTKASFLEKYLSATEGSFWVVMTKIKAQGMDVYSIEKSTTSGDKTSIDCCFKNGKLAIISIEYKDYQSENEILTGLKSKYGSYTSRKTINWNDFTNQEDRTTTITRWEQSPCCILELDYCLEIGLTELIFADKEVQTHLSEVEEIEDKSKIE